MLPGGIAPQAAAWAVDALLLNLAAYCLEHAIVRQRAVHEDAARVVDRDEPVRRFTALPAGEGHERFYATIGLLVDGLACRENGAG